MKPNEVEPDFDPAEALDEGAAQEEAWRLAADAPDVWTRAAVDEADLDEAIAASPVPIDRESARELFEPLASSPREVVLERVLMGFVEDRTEAGDAAVEGVSREVVLDRGVMRVAGDSPASAMSRAAPSGRWRVWLAIPLAAAAGALLTLSFTERRGAGDVLEVAGELQEGTVSAFRGTRAAGPRSEGAPLKVPSGSWFDLECRAPGQRLRVASVRAWRPGESAIRGLGFEELETTDEGAVLHVHAELAAGPWNVTCQVLDASGAMMSSYARIVVE
jgi:hypothetical protein